jgi:DNA-damage-inducible protein J
MTKQSLIQFRAEEELKREVTDIYAALGMDLPTAFRMFMTRTKIVRGLPFSAQLPEGYLTRSEAEEAFDKLRSEAASLPDMSQVEINAEIAAARNAKKAALK